MPRSAEERREALLRGAEAEAWVAACLEQDGWRVLDRNWRARGGELDIVVIRDGRVRFVEVKARGPSDLPVEDAVTPSKQRKLVHAGEAWLQHYDRKVDEVCFLVAIVHTAYEPWRIEWIDNAFDA